MVNLQGGESKWKGVKKWNSNTLRIINLLFHHIYISKELQKDSPPGGESKCKIQKYLYTWNGWGRIKMKHSWGRNKVKTLVIFNSDNITEGIII